MKYFFDTEFHEYHKQVKCCGIKISKPIPTIDLISIGIVAEDGREYYAISKDFNIKDAWDSFEWYSTTYNKPARNKEEQNFKVYWLRDNVLKPIYKELHDKENLYARQAFHRANVYIKETKFKFTYKNLKRLVNKYGKTNKQIAKEIIQFVGYKDGDKWLRNSREGNYITEITSEFNENGIQFYAYYADYDWVGFAQLFGKMGNLPDGFPMYCIDLKQMLDEKINDHNEVINGKNLSKYTLEGKLDIIKYFHPNYPKQTNEHNALADAKWNFELYNFLNAL